MKMEITLRREGDGLSTTLPTEIAELLEVGEGDKLYVVRTEHGYALAPTDSAASEEDVDEEMLQAFEEVREQYDDTFRRLAQ